VGQIWSATDKHRSEATPPPVTLQLVSPDDGPPHLEVVALTAESEEQPPGLLQVPLHERVTEALRDGPLPRTALRDRLSVKNERLGAVLADLERAGHIVRRVEGWALAEPAA
jgi:predicted Rossmann fold nucleotide-binding protein DprA/Smf involved in DNA uptake